MPARDANIEMSQSFDDAPPFEHMKPALAVLLAGLVGPPEAAASGEAKKKTRTEKPGPSTSA
jgi:hypothetical protein